MTCAVSQWRLAEKPVISSGRCSVEEPTDWKVMSTVGPGVREIRIRDSAGAFRIFYVATRPEGVFVLHCFQEKAQKTGRRDLELGRTRFKALPPPCPKESM